MASEPRPGTLIEKMTAQAHLIVDSLDRCAPRELESKTAALRNLQAAIKDGLGNTDKSDPSAAVMEFLALEVEEKKIALAERKAKLAHEPTNDN